MGELPSAPRGIPIEDIPALFASLPRLTPAEAEAFGRDIDESRPRAGDDDFRDLWGDWDPPDQLLEVGDHQKQQATEPGNAVDEVLDKLHELRLALDAHFGRDADKFFSHLREFEEQLLREGWVEAPPRSKRDESAA
jgi:hypothetical protein